MTNQKISEEQKAAARATKPQWLNINDVLYYQSKAGDEITFDLDFDSKVFEKAMSGEEDERGQFFMMLDALGDEHTVRRVREMGALEQSRVISRFFKEFAKAVDAEPGESGSSSIS
jgi:hypothetical protein